MVEFDQKKELQVQRASFLKWLKNSSKYVPLPVLKSDTNPLSILINLPCHQTFCSVVVK